MYLKSLELFGFKSFPSKTILNFNKGTTVIVGPNGSGKSNITDAIKWVLGEASYKNLRGSKMEDVVFAGTEDHRQMNFAEISITFDDSEKPKTLNNDFNEVCVTRRYYRTGDSEYYINKKSVRLKDIFYLFQNTGIGRDGYSVIGQGKVAEIISKKSDDRRSIFEESAGIARYRSKKHDAELELNEVNNNMLRINDIFGEIESNTKRLEKESQKAKKYLDYYDEKKKLDITLWVNALDILNSNLEKEKSDYNSSLLDLDNIQDIQNRLEMQSENVNDETTKNKETIQKIEEEIKDISEKCSESKRQYFVLENDITHYNENVVMYQNRQKEVDEDIEKEEENLRILTNHSQELEGEIQGLESDKKNIVDNIDETNASFETYNSKLEEQLKNQVALENSLNENKLKLALISSEKEGRGSRKTAINKKIDEYETQLNDLNKKKNLSEASVEKYLNELNDTNKIKKDTSEKIDEVTNEIESTETKRNGTLSQKSVIDARLNELLRMEKGYEGFSNSVRYIMNPSNSLKGIIGPVSDLIVVSKDYSLAIETALGSNMQNMVVADENCAREAITSLKNNNIGRMTFYPLNTIRPRKKSIELQNAKSYSGYIGFADELCSMDSKYRVLLSYLLGNVAIFDTLKNAIFCAKAYNWTIKCVTIDGQVINSGGSLTGGSSKNNYRILKRKNEIDKCNDEIKKYEQDLLKIDASLSNFNSHKKAFQNALSEIVEKETLINSLLFSERNVLTDITNKVSFINEEKNDLNKENSNINKSDGTVDGEIESINSIIESTNKKIELVKTERQDSYIKKNSAGDLLESYKSDLNDLLVKKEGFTSELNGINEQYCNCKAQVEKYKNNKIQYTKEIDSIKQMVLNADQNRKELSNNLEYLRKQSGQLANESKSNMEKNENLEKKVTELQQKIKSISSQRETYIISSTKSENRIDNLKSEIDRILQQMYDEYELTRSEAVSINNGIKLDNAKKVETSKKINELKNCIKKLGEVRINSIEEYSTEKKRYDHYSKQLVDLNGSKRELESIINSIDEEMKVTFIDAFNKINVNFKNVFSQLSGGGDADVFLADQNDPLGSGIEITAAPPGKVIKSLSLLSGGEQAIVAIALLFAMIQLNPSPFCVFDEIDTALDDVNIKKVSEYIKVFSKQMQIIIITHRKGMMETADTLYGVTMPVHGISKVLTLNIDNVSYNKINP